MKDNIQNIVEVLCSAGIGSDANRLTETLVSLEQEYGLTIKIVDSSEGLRAEPISVDIPKVPEPILLANPYNFYDYELRKEFFGYGHSTKGGRSDKQIRKDRKRNKNKKTHRR